MEEEKRGISVFTSDIEDTAAFSLSTDDESLWVQSTKNDKGNFRQAHSLELSECTFAHLKPISTEVNITNEFLTYSKMEEFDTNCQLKSAINPKVGTTVNSKKSNSVFSMNSFYNDDLPTSSAVVTESSVVPNISVDVAYLFINLKFSVQLENRKQRKEMERIIKSSSGIITSNDYDIAILPTIYSAEAHLLCSSCLRSFTKYWVYDCVEAVTLDVPDCVIHKPLTRIPEISTMLSYYVLCISGYRMIEKCFIREVARAMGAIMQAPLVRHHRANLKQTTHLICKDAGNEKYQAATRWGIPVVSSEWIFQSFTRLQILDLDTFHLCDTYHDSNLTECYLHATENLKGITKLISHPNVDPPQAFENINISKASAMPKINAGLSTKTAKSVREYDHRPSWSASSISGESDDESSILTENQNQKQIIKAKHDPQSPLLCGLSQEASRQLKRALNVITSNSPGPNISHLVVKRKQSTPDSVVLSKVWDVLRAKYVPRKVEQQSNSKTEELQDCSSTNARTGIEKPFITPKTGENYELVNFCESQCGIGTGVESVTPKTETNKANQLREFKPDIGYLERNAV